MKVPLLDLKTQYASLSSQILDAVRQCIESQNFILGPEVKTLEERVAASCGVPFAVGCASGSDALLLSLMASDFQPKQGVITIPFTFFATVGAVARLGGVPFFVDIDSKTYNLDPIRLEVFLREQCVMKDGSPYHRGTMTRLHSIIPVHLFGQCADMTPILRLAKEWKLLVIEDAAQALGASYARCPGGSMGDFGCFSFFPSKNLGGAGDGGMVVTSNGEYAEKLKILRVHGSKPKYHYKFVGINSRLDTLQAAILLVKYSYLAGWAEKRQANAKFYDERFKEFGSALITPFILPASQSVYNQYCIRIKNRDLVQHMLYEDGIGTEIYYPVPLHLQECFVSLGYKKGDFPISEETSSTILALPVYPELTSEQRQYVADCVGKAVLSSHVAADA